MDRGHAVGAVDTQFLPEEFAARKTIKSGAGAKMRTVKTIGGVILYAMLAMLAGGTGARAQKPVVSRVTAEVDDTRTARMEGNVHPLARAEFDRGAVAESQPMTRMMLLLQRSPEQETALRQLMEAQQDKGSRSARWPQAVR